jgi:hypothetical protein
MSLINFASTLKELDNLICLECQCGVESFSLYNFKPVYQDFCSSSCYYRYSEKHFSQLENRKLKSPKT